MDGRVKPGHDEERSQATVAKSGDDSQQLLIQ